MQGEDLSLRRSGASCHGPANDSCELPCAGCSEEVAAVAVPGGGLSLSQSGRDGCWVVRFGHAEKLRSDDPCLACSYFRNRAPLLAG